MSKLLAARTRASLAGILLILGAAACKKGEEESFLFRANGHDVFTTDFPEEFYKERGIDGVPTASRVRENPGLLAAMKREELPAALARLNNLDRTPAYREGLRAAERNVLTSLYFQNFLKTRAPTWAETRQTMERSTRRTLTGTKLTGSREAIERVLVAQLPPSRAGKSRLDVQRSTFSVQSIQILGFPGDLSEESFIRMDGARILGPNCRGSTNCSAIRLDQPFPAKTLIRLAESQLRSDSAEELLKREAGKVAFQDK